MAFTDNDNTLVERQTLPIICTASKTSAPAQHSITLHTLFTYFYKPSSIKIKHLNLLIMPLMVRLQNFLKY